MRKVTDMFPARTVFAIALAVLVTACGKPGDTQEPKEVVRALSGAEETELRSMAEGVFAVLPDVMPGHEGTTAEMIALGKSLYFDKRLSVNDKQSCNTCHDVSNGAAGVDNVVTSEGALGGRGTRNSPTVFNAGFHAMQFWDGRAADLIEQAKGPICNPAEMAMPEPAAVEAKLKKTAEYPGLFAEAFPEQPSPVTFDNVAKAIAAFERTLIAPSRFDKWITGDTAALTMSERRGMHTFINTGCISCHNGPLFGGNGLQKLGNVQPYATSDPGRYNVTKDPADSLMFKVPSLRLAARTKPYFHDGSVPTLSKAIELMGWHQLGKKLSNQDVAEIETFLKAL